MSGPEVPAEAPRFLALEVGGDRRPEQEAALSELVADIRSQADSFIFVSGGAKYLDQVTYGRLTGLFDALRLLSERGREFAVGDGGTRAGIMEAAGVARVRAQKRFHLLGVSPAFHISLDDPPPAAKVQIDPNHSVVVAVDNRTWDGVKEWGTSYWGSEVETMFRVFGRLSDGRPSVAIIANGGAITLEEVRQNTLQNRPTVLIRGSGRATDVIAALILPGGDGDKHENDSPDRAELVRAVEAMNLVGRKDLFHIFPISGTAEALADLVEALWDDQGA